MKKTLLAAALLAGFAGAAQAETSVTLYGIIDTGIGYQNIDAPDYDHSSVNMINGVQSGSRWGLRGTEDLGDGLRAVFQLESGFDSGDGDSAQGGRLFGRQATVGLASDAWGQLDFGRQTNIASKYFSSIDPFGAGFSQANIGVGISSANTNRVDNMILYQTPSYSGFQLGAGYSFSSDNNNGARTGFATADRVRQITAGIRYANGPLNVAFAFDQLNASNLQADDEQDATPRVYALGASYDFEVVKLALAYARTQDGWIQGFGAPTDELSDFSQNMFADGFKANSYMVGLTVPVGGSSSLFGSWQMVDPTDAENLIGPAAEGDEKMNVFSLGYTYDLSKRTNLYAYGSYSKNFAFIEDAKYTQVGVGIRHRF